MGIEGKKIGVALTGSFFALNRSIENIKELIKKEADVIPIMSYTVYNTNTKFGKADNFIKQIEEITGRKIIHTITEAELIGQKRMTDIMIVIPCSRKYNSKTCL